MSLSPILEISGVCAMCEANTQVARFRLEQVKTELGPSQSRTVLLCTSCRAPVVAIIKAIPKMQAREPSPFANISDLIETPALRAQRLGTKVPAKSRARKTP